MKQKRISKILEIALEEIKKIGVLRNIRDRERIASIKGLISGNIRILVFALSVESAEYFNFPIRFFS